MCVLVNIQHLSTYALQDVVDRILGIQDIQLKDSVLHAINTKNVSIIAKLMDQQYDPSLMIMNLNNSQ